MKTIDIVFDGEALLFTADGLRDVSDKGAV